MEKEMNRDAVEAPEHYTYSDIQPVDVIETWGLNWSLGNVVKYVARAEYKNNKLQDLKKAEWYLRREIARLENE
jgi:hypothetical protein